jgi:hypothetical protein
MKTIRKNDRISEAAAESPRQTGPEAGPMRSDRNGHLAAPDPLSGENTPSPADRIEFTDDVLVYDRNGNIVPRPNYASKRIDQLAIFKKN